MNQSGMFACQACVLPVANGQKSLTTVSAMRRRMGKSTAPPAWIFGLVKRDGDGFARPGVIFGYMMSELPTHASYHGGLRGMK
jgi:hypothetical protein